MARTSKHRVVVVTGASSGIGREVALRLARRGDSVVLAARRAEALEEVAAECRAIGGEAIAVPTDVADPIAVEELATKAVAAYGRVDAWVNNAGVYLLGALDETPRALEARVLDVNLRGVLHGAREAARIMKHQGSGVIVNVSSLAARAPYGLAAVYSASKAGVRALGEALRQELVGTGVHVVTVYPQAVDTPLFQHAGNFTGRALRAMPPIMTPERVARAIVDAIDLPRGEIPVGGATRLFTLLRLLARPLFDLAQPRLVRAMHLERREAPRTEGNLLQPGGPTTVRGGWRKAERRRWLALGGLGAAAATLLFAATRLPAARARLPRLASAFGR